ncbi:MAG: dTDP-4-dehydrorhamnose 3,5-epimerase [Candidatus Sericytochromatia bacterium]|nr:dTDP-4-dehydrorhamnose 3,5-epimerase [Candidatus Sericytochromatia bacterium]
MNVSPLALPGVILLEPRVHADDRGYFLETWHAARYAANGIPTAFVQDNLSRSRRGVLRGLHYQLTQPQGKLVQVTRGRIFDVAVDVRQGSPTFGQWCGVELCEETHRQLWIPAGMAHGFLVLSEVADVSYKCTSPYDHASERGVRWDDPALGIAWPLAGAAPRVSAKDAELPPLAAQLDLPPYLTPHRRETPCASS